MPKRQVIRQPVNKRIQRQRRRGVIPNLHGFFDRKTRQGNLAREQLKEDLLWARKRRMPHGAPYTAKGGHYTPQIMREYFRHEFEDFLRDEILHAETSHQRVRLLDIGPGLPKNFMPDIRTLDPEQRIAIHTLSPEQINPKTRRTDNVKAILQLSTGEKLPIFEREPNPEYEKRLRHQVQAIETVNPRRLGKFKIIVSVMGGAYYAKQKMETLEKVAQMLEIGGKAFLIVLAMPKKDYKQLQKQLGNNFRVRGVIERRETDNIIITRKR